MTAFYNFITSLEAYTKKEVARLCECYANATVATSPSQIANELKIAASIITDAPADPILFGRVKNLNELPYDELDARMGIHVVRSVFANEVHRMRARKIQNKSKALQTYLDEGVVVITDFLGAETAETIGNMTEQFPIVVNKQPFNLIHRMTTHSAEKDMILNGKMRKAVFECLMLSDNHTDASNQYLNNTFVQRVHNKPDDGDVQKVMHIDTYYDAVKFWYFPKEVHLENGPFTISPKSHIMTEKRLMWMQEAYMRHYENTIGKERSKDHAEGSLRILPDELAQLELSICHMDVPKDSLIISNVFGFHGRGNATIESIRDSIHGSIRLNSPFDNEE
jgi:hypothetical protein